MSSLAPVLLVLLGASDEQITYPTVPDSRQFSNQTAMLDGYNELILGLPETFGDEIVNFNPDDPHDNKTWTDYLLSRFQQLYLLRHLLAELQIDRLSQNQRLLLPDMKASIVNDFSLAAAQLPNDVRRTGLASKILVEGFLNIKAIERQLEAETHQNEKALPTWVRTDDIAAQLPEDSLLIEYVRLRALRKYAAYVIFPATEGSPSSKKSPVFMLLPSGANEIEREIEDIRNAIQDAESLVEEPGGAKKLGAKTEGFVKLMAAVKASLLKPVDREVEEVHPGEAFLDDDRWLILSPVADIWLVPFQAMPVDSPKSNERDRFIIEERKVSYQIAGRELALLKSRPQPRPLRTGLLVSNPDFGPMRDSSTRSETFGRGTRSSVQRDDAGRSQSRWTWQLQRVPCVRYVGCGPFRRRVVWMTWQWVRCPTCKNGRERDTEGDTTLAGKTGNYGPDRLKDLGTDFKESLADNGIRLESLGDHEDLEAKESFVRYYSNRGLGGEGQSPSVIVFCTHGFYLGTGAPTQPELNPAALNPALEACGLALADANRVKRSESILNDRDGRVHGTEIAKQYQLDNTDLVVLVACQTGEGEIESGNNVVSLRHAFTLAGARSVVASSWVVQVTNTQRLMNGFFENLTADPETRADREGALQAA